ncbi:MAG: DeoR/GlpR transcriptional regulator [Lachnospiraceae bacterium]|nr:DeoR/GlpR transcriptional regulator [Lachnospiraceae bacterium]
MKKKISLLFIPEAQSERDSINNKGINTMGSRKTKIDSRREEILTILQEHGKVSVAELSELLGVTVVTIRKDLDSMNEAGQLARVSGGAVLSVAANPSDYMHIKNQAEKRRIAEVLSEIIKDGDTIFINSGSTCVEAARALQKKKFLNVVTNAFDVAKILNDTPGFRVLLLGGELNSTFNFTYGSDAQEQLSHYKADWSILSIDGISTEGGITTCHAEEAIIDRMMIAASRQVIIAADHTKVGTAGFSKVCEVNDGKLSLITDERADRAETDALRQTGMKVTLA